MLVGFLRFLLSWLEGPTADRDFYAACFRDAPDPSIICASDYSIITVNEALCEVFGYKHYELVDKPLDTLIPERFHLTHRSKFDAFCATPERRPMAESSVFRARHKQGKEIEVQIALSPIRTERGTLVCGSLRVVEEVSHADD